MEGREKSWGHNEIFQRPPEHDSLWWATEDSHSRITTRMRQYGINGLFDSRVTTFSVFRILAVKAMTDGMNPKLSLLFWITNTRVRIGYSSQAHCSKCFSHILVSWMPRSEGSRAVSSYWPTSLVRFFNTVYHFGCPASTYTLPCIMKTVSA